MNYPGPPLCSPPDRGSGSPPGIAVLENNPARAVPVRRRIRHGTPLRATRPPSSVKSSQESRRSGSTPDSPAQLLRAQTRFGGRALALVPTLARQCSWQSSTGCLPEGESKFQHGRTLGNRSVEEYAVEGAGTGTPVARGKGRMSRQAMTDASEAMLEVLRQRGCGAHEVGQAFVPLIERRATQAERTRVLDAVKRLPTAQGSVQLDAVVTAILGLDEE
jgi:hypothetical protein